MPARSNGGDVNEHIRAAGILNDEAEPLLGVEKLDSTLSHVGPPFESAERVLCRREPFARFKSGFCVFLRKARYGRDGKAGSIANPGCIVGLR
jgi:hypothetical protein